MRSDCYVAYLCEFPAPRTSVLARSQFLRLSIPVGRFRVTDLARATSQTIPPQTGCQGQLSFLSFAGFAFEFETDVEDRIRCCCHVATALALNITLQSTSERGMDNADALKYR